MIFALIELIASSIVLLKCDSILDINGRRTYACFTFYVVGIVFEYCIGLVIRVIVYSILASNWENYKGHNL